MAPAVTPVMAPLGHGRALRPPPAQVVDRFEPPRGPRVAVPIAHFAGTGIRYADDGYVEAVVPAYRLDASSEFGRLHDNAALLVEEAARRVAVPPARALKGRRSRTADPDRWARSLNWEGRERRNLNDVVPASVVYRRAAPQAVNDGERLVEPLRPDTRRGVFAEGLKFDGDATQTCPEHDATAGKPVE